MSAADGHGPALATALPPQPGPGSMEPTLRLLRGELERRAARGAAGDGPADVDGMARSAMLPPGKLLRPLLFTESAAAVGMRREDALGPALGIESLHVGSLVHDDVIDGDELRRGRPTVVARHGMPDAIVTGDALLIGAFRALAACPVCGPPDGAEYAGYAGSTDHAGSADSADYTASADYAECAGCAGGEPIPAHRRLAVVRTLADAGVDLCRGQALEDALRGAPGAGLERYLTMVSLKTGALFRAACLGGGRLAGARPEALAALHRYAEHLGRAFQMTDDLLPHLSDTETSGKSVLSDIANGRPTFPLLLCWREAGEHERGLLAAALDGTVSAEAALEDVRDLLHRTGALESARAEAAAEGARARAALLDLPDGEARTVLAAVADLSVDRDR